MDILVQNQKQKPYFVFFKISIYTLYLPLALSSWLPISNLKDKPSEYNKLYAANRSAGSSLPTLSNAILSNLPGTSFGRIARSFIVVGLEVS